MLVRRDMVRDGTPNRRIGATILIDGGDGKGGDVLLVENDWIGSGAVTG
jgi:hypothetical protein